MARREADDFNELKITDNLSGSDVTLFYRMPTTSERQQYANAVAYRKKNQLVFNHAKARLEAGMKILTGFRVGDFERKIDGQYVVFSWKEADANYFPEWRQWMEKHAGDLVMFLAGYVFDSSCSSAEKEVEEEGEDIEGK